MLSRSHETAKDIKEMYLNRTVELVYNGENITGLIISTEVIPTGKIGSYDILCTISADGELTWLTLTELKALNAFGKVEVLV